MRSFLMLLALTLAQPVAPDDWCYSSQAQIITCLEPSKWTDSCQGNRQSPIDIDHETTTVNSSLIPFDFSKYNKKESWKIKNNGHSVEVELSDSISISGGGLQETYKAVAFHLHWSNTVVKGSEHTIDGKSYAMEMHIVHIKEKFQTLSEALAGPDEDEIAVLSFLIEPSSEKNKHFTNFVETLKNVSYKSNSARLQEISLLDLIPETEKLSKYYRYLGSLTTPKCQEKVIWTVFKEPIRLHNDQILEFSKKLFYNEEHKENMPIIDNFRPIQQLKGRRVFYSGVGKLLPYAWFILLTPLLTNLLTAFFY